MLVPIIVLDNDTLDTVLNGSGINIVCINFTLSLNVSI